MARAFHRTKFSDVSPTAIKHAKMILASTLASAAAGTRIGSACIVRELAKEHGGRPEAAVWFDPVKLPVTAVARVNTMLSDAAAFDDSDLRNIVHAGTPITAIGLAIGETTGATGQDVLCAMITGYEAAGRFGTTVQVGIPGVHPSMVSAFGATVAAAKLLGLTPEQMATAIRLTAVTAGGIAIGTYSWAREYQAGNAAFSAMNNALAARRGFVVTVNDDILEAQYGFLEIYGKLQPDIKSLIRTPGPDWDIDKHLAIKLLPGAHPIHPTNRVLGNLRWASGRQPELILEPL
jgi:2-methylcitrate dehydratase PrpD